MSKQQWYLMQLLIRVETLEQTKITYIGGKAVEAYVSLVYTQVFYYTMLFVTVGTPLTTQESLII